MGSRDSAPDSGRVHSSVRPPLTARPRRYPVSAGEPSGTIPPGRNSPESQGTIPPSPNSSIAPTPSGRPPKLLDRLSGALRARHYSPRTEQTYCHWVKRFIFFHHVRHPAEMAEPEVNAFLTSLAMKGKVSASTQNQALSALLFLYGTARGSRTESPCCQRR